jgi:hypothetical protein
MLYYLQFSDWVNQASKWRADWGCRDAQNHCTRAKGPMVDLTQRNLVESMLGEQATFETRGKRRDGVHMGRAGFLISAASL